MGGDDGVEDLEGRGHEGVALDCAEAAVVFADEAELGVDLVPAAAQIDTLENGAEAAGGAGEAIHDGADEAGVEAEGDAVALLLVEELEGELGWVGRRRGALGGGISCRFERLGHGEPPSWFGW